MKRAILQGRCQRGLYPLLQSPPSTKFKSAFTSVKATTDLWHCRLGHPSPLIVRVLRSNRLLVAPNKDNATICNACQQGKNHQLPFSSFERVSSSPLSTIFSDVWGPAVTSVGGYKYYVSFIDDFSKYT